MRTLALWLILVVISCLVSELEDFRHDFEQAHHLPDITHKGKA